MGLKSPTGLREDANDPGAPLGGIGGTAFRARGCGSIDDLRDSVITLALRSFGRQAFSVMSDIHPRNAPDQTISFAAAMSGAKKRSRV